jgi:integrase
VRYVFPGRSGDAPVKEVKGAWAALCEAAKLDGVWPHDLRRTFGTWQLQGGAALATVRDSLAQSDIRVTQASYAHVAADAVRESVEATAARITAASPKR